MTVSLSTFGPQLIKFTSKKQERRQCSKKQKNAPKVINMLHFGLLSAIVLAPKVDQKAIQKQRRFWGGKGPANGRRNGAETEPKRGPNGAETGPKRGQHGVHMEPNWGPNGAEIEPTRGPTGAHMGLTWGPHGAQMGPHSGPPRAPPGDPEVTKSQKPRK